MKSARAPQRLIAATVLVALSCLLVGCGTNGAFDPTDMLDFLDTKKKLPGERKPVFPEGVPGVEQGVPRDLYKGAQQNQDQPPVVAEPAPEPNARQGGAKSASRAQPSAQQPEPAPGAPGTSAVPVDEAPNADGVAAPPHAKRTARRRSITAIPKDDAPKAAAQPAAAAPAAQAPAPPPPQQSVFPAPLPSGGFQR